MIVDVVLILVIAAYAFLTGAALYGAGTSVANAVRRRRVTLAVEDQTTDEQPIIVVDYGRMAALPEALYEEPLVVDPPLSLREKRIVVPEVTA